MFQAIRKHNSRQKLLGSFIFVRIEKVSNSKGFWDNKAKQSSAVKSQQFFFIFLA